MELLAKQQPALAQAGDQIGDQLLVVDRTPRVAEHPRVVGSLARDRVEQRVRVGRVKQAVLDADAEVVLAECRRHVDDPGAVLGRHEVAGEHRRAARRPVGQLEDRAGVGAPDELRAAQRAEDLRALAEHPLDERLGDDQRLLADAHARIADLGPDSSGQVAGQRPRCGRPDQQRLLRLGAEQRQLDVDARVLDVLIALRHLVRGQRGAAARAVGDDAVALVEQPLGVDLLERPPDRLDV